MQSLQTQVGGSHYKDMAIQPFEYILANNIGFAEGTAIAYVSRWKTKNGIEDLEKAVQTLQILIEHERSKALRSVPGETVGQLAIRLTSPPAGLSGSGVLGAWVERHGAPGAPRAIEKAYDSMGRECVHGK